MGGARSQQHLHTLLTGSGAQPPINCQVQPSKVLLRRLATPCSVPTACLQPLPLWRGFLGHAQNPVNSSGDNMASWAATTQIPEFLKGKVYHMLFSLDSKNLGQCLGEIIV